MIHFPISQPNAQLARHNTARLGYQSHGLYSYGLRLGHQSHAIHRESAISRLVRAYPLLPAYQVAYLPPSDATTTAKASAIPCRSHGWRARAESTRAL